MFTPDTLGTIGLFSRATRSSVGHRPTRLPVMNLVLLVTFSNILISVSHHLVIAEEDLRFAHDLFKLTRPDKSLLYCGVFRLGNVSFKALEPPTFHFLKNHMLICKICPGTSL